MNEIKVNLDDATHRKAKAAASILGISVKAFAQNVVASRARQFMAKYQAEEQSSDRKGAR
jgi:hypothetical protein